MQRPLLEPRPIGLMLSSGSGSSDMLDFCQLLEEHGVHPDEMLLVFRKLFPTGMFDPVPVGSSAIGRAADSSFVEPIRLAPSAAPDAAIMPGGDRADGTTNRASFPSSAHHSSSTGFSSAFAAQFFDAGSPEVAVADPFVMPPSGTSSTSPPASVSSSTLHPRTDRCSWWDRYAQLQAFQREHGHCLVSARDNAAYPGLAAWVKRMRYQYKLQLGRKASSLTTERKTALDAVGFVYDSHQAAWEDQFQDLQAFLRHHGHCNVPGLFQENPTLGGWVKGQRRAYKLLQKGRKSSLNADRIRRLEGIGFQWSVRGSAAASQTAESASNADEDAEAETHATAGDKDPKEA